MCGLQSSVRAEVHRFLESQHLFLLPLLIPLHVCLSVRFYCHLAALPECEHSERLSAAGDRSEASLLSGLTEPHRQRCNRRTTQPIGGSGSPEAISARPRTGGGRGRGGSAASGPGTPPSGADRGSSFTFPAHRAARVRDCPPVAPRDCPPYLPCLPRVK